MSKTTAEVEAEIEVLRAERKFWLVKLAHLNDAACAHIENGSFEFVEAALADCKDGLCELQETIRQDKNKRRARKRSGGGTDEQTAAAGQAG